MTAAKGQKTGVPARSAGIEEQVRLLMRGVEYGDEKIHGSMESELRERLKEGRPLRVYCGYDPTSTDLTIGNAVSMRKLRQFQELGHETTFLIGNFTGLVGDPSDKDSARPMLTPEQVEANSRTWLRQAYRVLDREKTRVRYNADWLGELTMADVVKYTSHFTVAQFMERDIYVQRQRRGEAIYLHEFLYALLQAYDAVAMHTDVQVGGTDQLFNIMAGRTLQRAVGQKPQIPICLPVLLGIRGKSKMSKSLGNHISLDDPPHDMYRKVMRIPDDLMMDYFTLVTGVPEEELAEIRNQLVHRSVNPIEVKERLASEIVAQFYGQQKANEVLLTFRMTYRSHEPEDIIFLPEGTVDVPLPLRGGRRRISLPRCLHEAGVVNSVSDARSLIRQGGVKLVGWSKGPFAHSLHRQAPSEPVREPTVLVEHGQVFRVGKHRFLRIVDADKEET